MFDLKMERGFTLIELMVVLAVIALGTALVSLSLPDGDRRALNQDAERLAALLESARAQSRVAGVPVHWRATPGGFAFHAVSSAFSALEGSTFPDAYAAERAARRIRRRGTGPALRLAA